MAEKFLDRANVRTSLQQMGGETVAQGMAGGTLGPAKVLDGLVHGSLNSSFVDVMATLVVAAGIFGDLPRGEDVLPFERVGSFGEFAIERVWQPNPAEVATDIAQVERLAPATLLLQRSASRSGQHDDAILVALANGELVTAEVDVLDAQTAALHLAQAG